MSASTLHRPMHGGYPGRVYDHAEYACLTPTCPERLQGTTTEPGLWCSICLEDLEPVLAVTRVPSIVPDELVTALERRREAMLADLTPEARAILERAEAELEDAVLGVTA